MPLFRNTSISTRISALALIPLTIVLGVTGVVMYQSVTTLNNAKDSKEFGSIILQISSAINSVQDERRDLLSNSFVDSNRVIALSKLEFVHSDSAVKGIVQTQCALDEECTKRKPIRESMEYSVSYLTELPELRNQFLSEQGKPSSRIPINNHYQITVENLIENTEVVAEKCSENREFFQTLSAYIYLTKVVANAENEYHLFSSVIESDSSTSQEMIDATRYSNLQDAYAKEFLRYASEGGKLEFLNKCGGVISERVERVRLGYFFDKTSTFRKITRDQWRDAALTRIIRFREVESIVGKEILTQSDILTQKAQKSFAIALAVALAAIVIVAFASWKIIQSILIPLKSLLIAVTEVERGNYNPTITVFQNDELGKLTVSFRSMIAGLRNALSELHLANDQLEERVKHRTIELESEIVTRMQAEKSLVEAMNKAEDANRAKSAFLASMSHELRTPLNSIIGFSHLLLNDSNLGEKHRQNVGMMSRSGEHLLNLINDILDISKIEAGKLELFNEPTSVGELVETVRSMLGVKAKEKGLELSIQIERNIPRSVLVDPRRLLQVLLNLCGNAIKFTERGGVSVFVHSNVHPLQSDVSTITFAVRDTGRGIASSQLASIFDPFKQDSTQHSEGTGLGLAISQKIINKMGGEISVSSTINVGTTFEFSINVQDLSENVSFKDCGCIQHIERVEGTASALIVDDIESNRVMLEQLLSGYGIQCSTAANGEEAIEQVLNNHFDIVFLDLMMPVKDGKQTIHELRTKHNCTTLPIVAFTADVLTSANDELLALGFTHVLRKPIVLSEVENTLLTYSQLSFVMRDPEVTKNEMLAKSVQPLEAEVQTIVEYIQSLPTQVREQFSQYVLTQDFENILDALSSFGNDSSTDESIKQQLIIAAKESNFKFFIELGEMITVE